MRNLLDGHQGHQSSKRVDFYVGWSNGPDRHATGDPAQDPEPDLFQPRPALRNHHLVNGAMGHPDHRLPPYRGQEHRDRNGPTERANQMNAVGGGNGSRQRTGKLPGPVAALASPTIAKLYIVGVAKPFRPRRERCSLGRYTRIDRQNRYKNFRQFRQAAGEGRVGHAWAPMAESRVKAKRDHKQADRPRHIAGIGGRRRHAISVSRCFIHLAVHCRTVAGVLDYHVPGATRNALYTEILRWFDRSELITRP